MRISKMTDADLVRDLLIIMGDLDTCVQIHDMWGSRKWYGIPKSVRVRMIKLTDEAIKRWNIPTVDEDGESKAKQGQ